VKKEFEKKIFNYDYLLDPQIQQNNVYSLVAQDVVEVLNLSTFVQLIGRSERL